MVNDEKSQLLETLAHEKAHSELNKIEGYEGIKEELKEKQKPIILMDEFEKKTEKERKPCLNPCPVHCKNRE
jgi:23S rRNA A2030 N6-methylase RlmJ